MRFQSMEFHNVVEMEREGDAWRMWRVPGEVRAQLSPEGQPVSGYSTGCEIRFRVGSGGARVTLRSVGAPRIAYLFFGSFQAGWTCATHLITERDTVVSVPCPGELPEIGEMRRIAREAALPFSPDLVRILLPAGPMRFVRAEGEISPPGDGDMPRLTCLSYGSSITHGSLALLPHGTYPFRMAQDLGCDSLNLGFPGTCRLERALAEHIAARTDWDFATLELGINMIGDEFPLSLFEERVRGFLAAFRADVRPVFVTNIFRYNQGHQDKAARMRRIVEEYAGDWFTFTDGLSLLDRPDYISQDMVHPSLPGVECIARNWAPIVRRGIAGPR